MAKVAKQVAEEAESKVELEIMPPADMEAESGFAYDVDATLKKAAVLVATLKKEIGQ